MATEANPQITIYNHTTGQITVRDMTAEEIEKAKPTELDPPYETPSPD